jgi:RHS repeat-associated protein
VGQAAGIGGMLAVFEMISGQISNGHFACYDGNGNVDALLRAGDSAVSARYDYSPFGSITRTTGPIARNSSLLFSTKIRDEETSLVYYGHRYYSPATGRFVNGDRIQEQGGRNLYAFVLNSPIALYDTIGDTPAGHHPGLSELYRAMEDLGGGPGSDIIKYWTIEFNANHPKKHNLYNESAWEHPRRDDGREGFRKRPRGVFATDEQRRGSDS